jgi:hypothetical protein
MPDLLRRPLGYFGDRFTGPSTDPTQWLFQGGAKKLAEYVSPKSKGPSSAGPVGPDLF